MSNPSINRWGLNLFWYNLWYTDKNKALSFHQDHLTDTLVQTYINFGILQKKNFFFSKFWCVNNDKKLSIYKKPAADKIVPYFRFVEYKNKFNDEINILKIRIKKKNLHFSKLWILKYQGWLIVNLYLLQPLKKKIFFSNKKVKDLSFILEKTEKAKKIELGLIRYCFLIKTLNKLLISDQNRYNF